jgi:hypothetical protein
MSNCIIWNGPVWSQGRYGMVKHNRKSMGAHRAAWILKYGDIPDGLVVCHKCDNGLCVNTEHLFLGTMKDNMQDCIQKNRFAKLNQKGENNNNSKLSMADYANIQKDRLLGMTYRQLKEKYTIKSNGHLKNIIDYEII